MTIVANLIILLLNLGVLGLSIKLYTEILKDKSQDARTSRKSATTQEPSA